MSDSTELSLVDDELFADLEPQQQLALQHLLAGNSFSDAARLANVARCTLYRWIRDDPNFLALYNQWRSGTLESARARLIHLSNASVDTLQHAIETGDVQSASLLLKSLGLLSPPAEGFHDPSEISMEIANRRRCNWVNLKTIAADIREQHDRNLQREPPPTREQIAAMVAEAERAERQKAAADASQTQTKSDDTGNADQ